MRLFPLLRNKRNKNFISACTIISKKNCSYYSLSFTTKLNDGLFKVYIEFNDFFQFCFLYALWTLVARTLVANRNRNRILFATTKIRLLSRFNGRPNLTTEIRAIKICSSIWSILLVYPCMRIRRLSFNKNRITMKNSVVFSYGVCSAMLFISIYNFNDPSFRTGGRADGVFPYVILLFFILRHNILVQ